MGYSYDLETGKEEWSYEKGCGDGDQNALYQRAVPGQVYNFDSIPIEVKLSTEEMSLYDPTQTSFIFNFSFF